ncbi:MAG TPA: Uma2 family endonuclease [Bryobacteraceae bacterium]|nr:Uma2 family endonuclease [Bryobacteraceae bacterium]
MPRSPYPKIMRLTIPENIEPETLVIAANSFSDDDEFLALCAANPDLRMERTSDGEVLVMAPCGGESSFQNSEAVGQLREWAIADRRGIVVDSSGGFRLPDSSIRAADAAWVRKDRLATLSKQAKRKFIPLSPDFVIEVLSPSDKLSEVRAKMREWVEQGVPLAWLIIPDDRLVEIYRPGQSAETLRDAHEVRGEGLLDGFVLTLDRIWEGI